MKSEEAYFMKCSNLKIKGMIIGKQWPREKTTDTKWRPLYGCWMNIHFVQNILLGTWVPSFDLEHHSRCWHIQPSPGAVETESPISIDSVETEITCSIVPPPAPITTICCDIATVRIIVTIVCCEVHSILNVGWYIHDVTQVTGIPSDMDSVILWFALYTECVVFSWIPRTVLQHEFDPQFVWSAVRHLVNLLQSQPEVPIGTSESNFEFFPGSIERCPVIANNSLLQHDPFVNRWCRESSNERNGHVDSLIVGHEIWNSITVRCMKWVQEINTGILVINL